MIFEWPRGRDCNWEYFMFQVFGITLHIERTPERSGIRFAAQTRGLFGTSFVLHFTMNHFYWAEINIMFRHIYITLGVFKPRKGTGFPTLTFRTPWCWERAIWKKAGKRHEVG